MRTIVGSLLCGLLPALVPVPSTAAPRDGYDAHIVRCESEDMRWTRCPMPSAGEVELVRQLSGRACVRGTDWGSDEQGVWVARGCRAEFRARRSPQRTVRHVIRCESRARAQSCPVVLRGAPVRLLRSRSAAPCRRDSSWGVGRNEIWVARGCRGEFEIGDEDGTFPSGPHTLACESKNRIRRTCYATVLRKAELVRQLSATACTEGQTWGWDADGVWVDDGCRGEFRVD